MCANLLDRVLFPSSINSNEKMRAHLCALLRNTKGRERERASEQCDDVILLRNS